MTRSSRRTRIPRLALGIVAGGLLFAFAAQGSRAADKQQIDSFANGKPHVVYNLDKQGRKTGTYKEYDPTGRVVISANYAKGNLQGAYRSFFPNGKPKIVAGFHNGKLFGKYRRFTTTGEVAWVANYKGGKLHGERQEFSAGKLVKDELWTNGTLASEVGLKGGKLHGPRRKFADNRIVADEFWYEGRLLIPKGPQLIMQELAAIKKIPLSITGKFPPVPDKLNETLRTPAFQADQESALHKLMEYRYLADLPYADMEIDRDYAAHCQAGAELLTRVGHLTHTPENPGLPDAEYKFAYDGPSHSNISTAGNSAASVAMYMDDSDAGNIAKLGHRRWCLNPAMLKTGFGADGHYTCMWSFDGSRRDIPDYDAVAFPPRGIMPTTHFGANYAWSFSVNPQKYRGARFVGQSDGHAGPLRSGQDHARAGAQAARHGFLPDFARGIRRVELHHLPPQGGQGDGRSGVSGRYSRDQGLGRQGFSGGILCGLFHAGHEEVIARQQAVPGDTSPTRQRGSRIVAACHAWSLACLG